MYSNRYSNSVNFGGVCGCSPVFTKCFDLRKLVTHTHVRTPIIQLGVKWSQVQILSARPLKWPLSCEDGRVAHSSYVRTTRKLSQIVTARAKLAPPAGIPGPLASRC